MSNKLIDKLYDAYKGFLYEWAKQAIESCYITTSEMPSEQLHIKSEVARVTTNRDADFGHYLILSVDRSKSISAFTMYRFLEGLSNRIVNLSHSKEVPEPVQDKLETLSQITRDLSNGFETLAEAMKYGEQKDVNHE